MSESEHSNVNRVTLYRDDCANVLTTLDANSVDAIVTDPPAGIGFMGREWDHHKGGRAQWIAWLTGILREGLRVLKPGGHAVVWALPRTSHWTATAVEDAGFEIRDVLQFLFSTGFPKSLDISKSLDRQAGAEREVVDWQEPFGREGRSYGHYTEDGKKMCVGFDNLKYGSRRQGQNLCAVTAPATPAAQQWAGWGSALKPSAEFWILARKPLSEPTLAENVLRWGTGGLNIDACRIPVGSETIKPSVKFDGCVHFASFEGGDRPWIHDRMSAGMPIQEYQPHSSGRFPAHTLHDGSAPVLAEFAKAGERVSKWGKTHKEELTGNETISFIGSKRNLESCNKYTGDTGSAARFFACCPPDDDDLADLPPFVYLPKPSKRDRNEGLHTDISRNFHPTVKSTPLMSWFIRLVTPPQGIVLDPFMGSGSTGKAAVRGGWAFIGIEQDSEYFAIAERRIAHAGQPPRIVTRATPPVSNTQLSLF